jgi:hypothetical protein
VLISSAGIVINQHFCQDQLKSSSLFVSAENCHDAKKKFCPNHMNMESDEQESKSGKNCCDDESEYISVDNEQVIPSQLDYSIDIDFVVAYVVAYCSTITDWEFYLEPTFELYKPPPIFDDLVIVHQAILC